MANMTTQADADFLRFDNLEAVTVQLEGRNNENQEISVPYALKRRINVRRDTYVGVEITSGTRVWNIRKSDLAGAELLENDLIIDGQGTRWKVLSLELVSFDTRYRAICNKLRSNV